MSLNQMRQNARSLLMWQSFFCVSMYSKVCMAGAHSSSALCSPLWCVYASVCVTLKRIWISKFVCVCLCWGSVFCPWELLLVWPPVVRSHILSLIIIIMVNSL